MGKWRNLKSDLRSFTYFSLVFIKVQRFFTVITITQPKACFFNLIVIQDRNAYDGG